MNSHYAEVLIANSFIKIITPGAHFSNPVTFQVWIQSKFWNQTSWLVTKFLAHKPVNFASFTDNISLDHFQNYWNFDLECKHGKHKTASGAWKVIGTFEKWAPATTWSVSRSLSESPWLFYKLNSTTLKALVHCDCGFSALEIVIWCASWRYLMITFLQ